MFILKIPCFSIIIRHFTFLEEIKMLSYFRQDLKTLLYGLNQASAHSPIFIKEGNQSTCKKTQMPGLHKQHCLSLYGFLYHKEKLIPVIFFFIT